MEVETQLDAPVKNIYLRQLKEYEATKRLSADERKGLREWVSDRNSVYSNPFHVYGGDGKLVDYISACRHCVKEHKAKLRKELKEYELSIAGLTDKERDDLRKWVLSGTSLYDNPCHMVEDDGRTPLDFIEAIRTCGELREEYQKPMPEAAG